MSPRLLARIATTLGLVSALVSPGCNGKDDALASAASAAESAIPDVPEPPADGPKLAAIAETTTIYERPATDSAQLGYLRAGAMVARAAQPFSKDGCPGGWYPIRPRGFVCVGEQATLDLSHPTLAVMKTLPRRDAPLPYAYVRSTGPAKLYVWDRSRGAAVREIGKLRARSRVAVVGSWNAMDPEGKMQRLAMTPAGQFVRADDFTDDEAPPFQGIEVNDEHKLPFAFVVKRGVRSWKIAKGEATKLVELEPLSVVDLTGKFRTLAGEKFWQTAEDKWVRHKDVTVVLKRHVYPDFANATQKWIDVSVVTGVMVLYQGKKPVFATLVSVGQERLGDPATSASTQLGTFAITAKHLTSSKPGTKPFDDTSDMQDVPWVQELSSGQSLHGAFWHSRFGVEHGPGNVQLSPADAARLFTWTDPPLPDGWHAVGSSARDEQKTIVLVRK